MKAKWVLSLLVLALVSSSFAGDVVGNFEDGSMDGWNQKDATLSLTATGATVGSGALQVTIPGGWKLAALKDAKAFRSTLGTAGAKITMDLSMQNSNNSIPGWWVNPAMVINGQNYGTNNNIGWQDLGVAAVGVPWDFTTFSLSWTLPETLTAKIAATDDSIEWFELAFCLQSSDTSGATVFVDNIQIVPEPATMGILSLGALLLMKRRRV